MHILHTTDQIEEKKGEFAMNKNKSGFKYEFPISEELTVVLSADSLDALLKKVGIEDYSKYQIKDVDTIICGYVSWKLKELACNYVLTDKYRAILEEDANNRMMDDSVQPSNVGAYVNWCWRKNAGHWADGTPITDD